MLPLILLTNDDGIDSRGLTALELALSALGQVFIVAPDREMSASSHRITVDRPIVYHQVTPKRYAVDGTPADCVIVACNRILKMKPSLVISGVNRGYNIGDDVSYSGTVAAASEAVLQGIPAMAISTFNGGNPDFVSAARVAAQLAARVFEDGLPPDVILNVNFPEKWNGVVQLTRQGRRSGSAFAVAGPDPRITDSFWFKEEPYKFDSQLPDAPMTDFAAIAAGYVSVSPLHLDRTAHTYIDQFVRWVDGLSAKK